MVHGLKKNAHISGVWGTTLGQSVPGEVIVPWEVIFPWDEGGTILGGYGAAIPGWLWSRVLGRVGRGV